MNLDTIEHTLAKQPESLAKQMADLLLWDVWKLRHELEDPRYMYAGNRCTRAAIIGREAELDALRNRTDLAKFKEVFEIMRLSYAFTQDKEFICMETDTNNFFFTVKETFVRKERKLVKLSV